MAKRRVETILTIGHGHQAWTTEFYIKVIFFGTLALVNVAIFLMFWYILILSGIPYLTQPEEQKMRGNLEEKHKYENSTSTSTPSNGEGVTIPVPEQHVAFIEDVW